MYLIPLHAVVRDPDDFFNPLPAEGKELPNTAYWRRRLKVKDVVEGPPPGAATKKEKGNKSEAGKAE